MSTQLFKSSPQKELTLEQMHIQSEAQVKFSELRYRRLFETAQDGILILNADTGKIADANPFLKQILGYSQAELLGKELWEIGVFKDIKDAKEAFIQLKSRGYIRYLDLPLQTKDGRSIDVEFISNVYLVGPEKVIQCNIRDITNRRTIEKLAESRAEKLEVLTKSQETTKKAMLNVMEDLEEAKSRIEIEKVKDEAMLDSIGDGLIAVDNNRKIMVVNKSAEAMLGWKLEDMLGKEINSLPLEDEEGNPVPFSKRPTYKALASGKMVNNIYYITRKDKTRFPIAINVTPIKLGTKIIGAIDIFRDITREREVDRAKSEFVSLASHQLRTPLGISKWYLEALKEENLLEGLSDKAKDYLNEVYKSNERLLALVRGLLSVSRIDQGTVRDTPKNISIVELIKEVVKEMKILADKIKITINTDFPDTKIPDIFVDPLRMHQVVQNLVSNALDYSFPDGVIEVKARAVGGMIEISVKDSGIGISPEDQKMLYTKFFRSAKAINKNTEGSGLGLYVVKSYIETWGGKIEVKSDEGKGALFTIILPLVLK